ncbi:Rpn family recombination-promoting nuclease/putative transposase [Pantoea sp. Acro-807]|uniref:Rpn family recombination-promoting nuclease/putative transposase n=1 Tax=Pantoea sp. Acro-807 TaxID=2608356 RepID=UPI0014193FBC|nr:Rpn family recombination-promoting nuclease/putative transposase [Pantoea sp. Acro-807]NIE72298.1 Rpn family recombination-promoting nuclease/putative transposase [Pantoea sp. Acro-807]
MTGQHMHARANYMLQAGETADAGAFIRELAQWVPQHEDELMTIAQQLEQKGRLEGWQEGWQEGWLEGREEGLREGIQEASLRIARNLLKNGMDIQSVMNVTGLTEEELKHSCR